MGEGKKFLVESVSRRTFEEMGFFYLHGFANIYGSNVAGLWPLYATY